MTFPQHMAPKDFLIFSFPQNSITHCSCNFVYGSLKRAQLHSYCSLELSFLTPEMECLWLPPPPPNLNLLLFKQLSICPAILDRFTQIVLLWQLCSHGGATETVLLLLWTETHALKNAPWGGEVGGGSPGMSSVQLCVRERQNQEYLTVHSCGIIRKKKPWNIIIPLNAQNIDMTTEWTAPRDKSQSMDITSNKGIKICHLIIYILILKIFYLIFVFFSKKTRVNF